MRETLDILYGVTGQVLEFEAPEGRPSSVADSQVFENTDGDDGVEESALSSTAAVDSDPNTTTDAAAGSDQSDPHLIPVTATTGFVVGREYRIVDATGEGEWFECTEIASGVSVKARHQLQNEYASGSSVYTTRITHAVDSTWVAETNHISAWLDPNPRYRWRLTYVVGGVTYVHPVWFDLVRYKGNHTVRGLDVDATYPGWIVNLPYEHRVDLGARLIRKAYQQVKIDLHQEGKADQMARNGELIDELVVFKAGVLGEHAKIVAGGGDPVSLELAETQYERRFQSLIKVTTKVPFDVDSTGAARKVLPLGISRR